MKDYEKTQISPNKGEKWFCSEEEARKSGWQKAPCILKEVVDRQAPWSRPLCSRIATILNLRDRTRTVARVKG